MKAIIVKLRLTIILAGMLCFGISVIYAQFAGGTGTESDPYQVATAEHLSNVTDYLTAYFVQTADIDLGVAPWNEGEGWVPIGMFHGTYEGSNHVISNLYISRPTVDNQGLFGQTTICNIYHLKLTNVYVMGHDNIGGLIGNATSNANVDHCSVQGIVASVNNDAGGLIGRCVAGWHITNCYADVHVFGVDKVGGLIGELTTSSVISTCYAKGIVMATGMHTGGLVGYFTSSRISDCYARAYVEGGTNVGGLLGCFYSAELYRSYSTGMAVARGSNGGGLVGDGGSSTSFQDCYWDMNTSAMDTSAGGVGRTTDEMTYPYDANTFVGWSFPGTWGIDTPMSINDGYPFLTNNHITAIDDDNQVVSCPELSNFPNPFCLSTQILYQIKATTRVEIDIYNLKGERLYGLVNGVSGPGSHTVFWNGKTDNGNVLPSGVYLCRLIANGKQVCRKLILMK